MDLFQGQAMNGGLRLGQTPKYLQDQRLLALSQTGSLDDFLNLRQEAMALFFLDFNAHEGGRETSFADLLDFHANRQIQGGEGLLNRAGVNAGVNQSAERHVAADAAETI